MRIDSHQHFWRYDEEEFDWISDDMHRLKQDFLPKHLAKEFEKNNVQGCMTVQARQTKIETRWLLELADKNPMILGVVGWIDLCADDLEQQLSEFENQPKLKGFRHVIQAEASGYMLKPAFIRGVSLIAEKGYSFDLLIHSKQLCEVCELVKILPRMKLVIDHIAKPNIASREWEDWHTYIAELASYKHVFCKLSGMVTEAHWSHWKESEIQPYIQHVIECFGAHRCMYGSDWPVCQLASDYHGVISLMESMLTPLNKDESQAVFGETASRFYRLN